MLFCLRLSAAHIVIYHLKEGIFQQIGVYQEEGADAILAEYEKYGLLAIGSDDVYSGLYVLNTECCKVFDKNVHILAMKELRGKQSA